jgi:hypothetical protein
MPNPPLCPYCQQASRLVTGADVYPHRDDLMEKRFYQCVPCEAHVGTHAKSGEPLGTLANATLRSLRSAAHDAFDPLWKRAVDGEMHGRKKRNQHVAQIGHYIKKHRTAAYTLLAKAMDISVENCHIGVFTEDQCRQVIHLCTSGDIYLFREVSASDK